MYAYGRLVEAATRYGACKAARTECKIVVSGGDAQHTGRAEAVVYRNTLMQLGIAAADVLIEPHSMNTYQNAEFVSIMLRHYGADRVLLVSSGFHLRRAALYLAHFGFCIGFAVGGAACL
jgi:uncharacterized SAM-binding protein YcdF (DUF218 family)